MFGLIMIGGRGTRFWPLSKIKKPKQLIDFTGNGEMIRLTVDRLKPVVKNKDFFVITSKHLIQPVKKILNEIKNVVGEPEGKNTAPCIAMALGILYKNFKDEILGVFPGDHYIKKESAFVSILKKAETFASKNNALITIGIKPDSPHTGYGYIEFDKSKKLSPDIFKVKKFYEKPDFNKAHNFFKSGNFLWNAGIFIWKIGVIVESFKKYQPQMYDSIIRISNSSKKNLTKTIYEEFKKMPKISIDYAIMEYSDNIVTIPADIGWNDIGSWSSLDSINSADKNGNVVISKKNILLSSNRNIIHCKNKMVAAIGVDDLIIASDDDCILVCKKESDQKVGDIVKNLESLNLREYL
ncbi:mannose-1-phosphate guanylyltransferase [Candidatus Dependentiae bacterium]|nr:mannose-1-phosphate guanylyltransferase [Candidatus Dependentiae bacterium]